MTSFTDYSVRVLIYADMKKEELSSFQELPKVSSISSNHLMKVIHHLGKGNYLETIRGKNGGFRLAKEPKDINISELIRYTEDDLTLVKPKNDKLDQTKSISFSVVVDEALDSFMATLENYTLADLVKGQTLTNFLN